VQEGWFGVSEFGSDIAGESEVWVLVDCAGDKGWNIVSCAKYVGVRVGERGCSLDRCEVDLADVVAGRFVDKCMINIIQRLTIRRNQRLTLLGSS